MGIAIGGVALIVLTAIVIYWFRHRNDVIYVDTQAEADALHVHGNHSPRVIVRDCEEDCPCRHGHLHHHVFDQHKEVLRRHPDSFVALHPVTGVVACATPDIMELYAHMSKLEHSKSLALAVVHTSELQPE